MKKTIFISTLLLFTFFSWINPNALLPVEAVITYNLTYEMYGGNNHIHNPISSTDAQADVVLLPASKTDLHFQGWYKSEAFTEFDRVEALPGEYPGITKLYAKWGVIPYTIDFETNGGSVVSQQFAIPKLTATGNPVTVNTASSQGDYASISRDLNGDGYGDFISFNNGNRHVYMSNGVGGFNYSYVTNNLHSSNIWFAKFVDVNNDDLEDLIVVGDSNTITYSLRQPDGSLGPETLFTLQGGGAPSFYMFHFDMADINGDGLMDLAYADAGRISYRLNQGSFILGPAVSVGEVQGYGRGVRMADFNGDGHLDIFGASDASSFFKWGNGVTPFGGLLVNPNFSTYRGFISDVDKDNNIELIGLPTYTSTPSVFGFNADQTPKPRTSLTSQLFSTAIWYGDEMDLNGDGYNDLFYVMNQTNSGMISSNGDGTYDVTKFSGFFPSLAVGTVVYDPGYGTFGFMRTERAGTARTQYLAGASNQMSVAHLANTLPTKEGYTFAGWFDNDDLLGTAYNFSTPVTSSKTLYAKWTLNAFPVTYELNGGTNDVANPTSVSIESSATTLAEPTKGVSRFLGWYTTSDFSGSPITSIPAAAQQAYTLYAKWLDPVTVSYISNGGSSVSSLSDLPGEVFTQPTNPTRAGYTFNGWFTNEQLTNAYTFNLFPSSSLSLYAKWTALSFTITFETNGGTSISSIARNTDQTLNLPTNPTRVGYTFAGWFTNAGLTSSFSASVMPPNDVTLYAKWSIITFNISYNLNGGTNNVANPSFVTIESPLITLGDPTKAGYRFLGWYTTSDFSGSPITVIPAGAQQTYTLYAQWTALSFTITFETNGGTSISSIARNTDQTLNLPTNPTRVGYTFAGWFTNAGLTSSFSASVMPPNDVTLYAKWVINSHSLTWVVDGRVYTSAVQFAESIEDLLPTPTKYQHEFLGWARTGTTLIDISTFTMPDEQVTLTAIFRDNVDPVIFTVTDGDTYDLGLDIVFNEGTATLNGQTIQSGHRILLPGQYELVVTDSAGNSTTVAFTVIVAGGTLQWILFAAVLGGTWLLFAILYFLNRGSSSGGPGGTLVMNTPAPKPRAVIQTKKTVTPQQPVNQATVAKTEVKPTIQPQAVQPVPPVQETKPSPQPKPVEVKKPEPKVEVKKPIDKAPPMPIVKPEEIDQQLTETVIFKTPLKVKVDPVESYTPELKQSFDDTFVSEKRAVKVPELTYVPQTTNVPFYTNLFRYIHRFAGVLTEGLLASLTQSVIKLTDDKEAQLKIVEASTRTAEGLKTNQNQDYLLKILRRNVALNRDVLNPRNKYVYSYQRLATLLEEKGIYLEAVILVREAFERGLVDTPDMTFEKRLTRLEKKLVDSGGQRQDMIRK